DNRLNKESLRILTGVRGDLGQHARYDLSLNIGRVDRNETILNNRMYDRYLAAIDAVIDPTTGQVVCRSNLDPGSFNSLPIDFISTAFQTSRGPATFTPGPNSGCIPFNPFTLDDTANHAATAWIWIPTSNRVKNHQRVVTGYVAGDSGAFFNFHGGPIEMVIGGEYRKESSSYTFDALSGSDRVVAFNNGRNLNGEFDVREGFIEVSLPLFRDLNSAVRSLKLDAAARYSDYSTVGATSTWKLGALWETVAGLSLRGTWSSAVRAPNIGELYEARSNISIALGQRDPCALANLDLGTEYRRSNCATALNALGIDPNTFNPMLGTFFPAISGGNPNLGEETARTRTYGVLWQVPFINNLALTVDWYDIRMSDAVLRTNQNTIFNACYDSPSLDNIFCRLIGRDPTNGYANFAELSYVNVAEIRSTGLELSAFYTFETANAGSFRGMLNATHMRRLGVQKSLLPVITDEKGLFNTDLGGSTPEWVASFDLSWNKGAWDANYGYSYSSKTLRAPPLINAQRDIAHEIIDAPYVKPYRNHDVQVGYRLNDRTRLHAGVRNISDQYPDKTRGSLNGPSGRQGYAGRTFYIGFRMNFGDIWN
ncbi:MAG: TonB-dependent receptor, partial [Pseudomonadota bacterium]|nr:TonB-dependent receptor [Pseudomonadota bacterium]